MRVWMGVSVAEAVKHCKTKSGILKLDLTEQDLESLSPEQRAELAQAAGVGSATEPKSVDQIPGGAMKVALYPGWSAKRYPDPAICEASLDELVRVLDARLGVRTRLAAQRAEEQAEKERVVEEQRQALAAWLDEHREDPAEWVIDPRSGYHTRFIVRPPDPPKIASLPSDDPLRQEYERRHAVAEVACHQAEVARSGEIRAKRERQEQEKAVAAQRLKDAIAALIAEHGTANQLGRLEAGALPESEALDLARDLVFARLEGEPRYQKITRSEATAAERCECCDFTDPEIKFRSWTPDELDAATWDRLQEVEAKAPEGATCEVKAHGAWCDRCHGGDDVYAVRRLSIRIAVDWHGRELSRLYACGE